MITKLASRAFNPVAETVIAIIVFRRVFPIPSKLGSSPMANGLIGLVSSIVEVFTPVPCILSVEIFAEASMDGVVLEQVATIIILILIQESSCNVF